MEAAKRVAKNTGILYARMAITVFISLYSTRLILAALGVADFGLFNLVGGVISMLGFLNSSMAAATQRYMSFAQGARDLEKVKRIFNMSSLLHWGITVLVLLLLEGAGYFFFHGVLNIAPDRIEVAKLIYQFMVISTLFTVISVPYEAVITSHENMMVYAILGVFEAVLKLGIAFYITHTVFDHLVMYGVLMTGLSVLLLIIKRIYCHRVYEECHLHIRKYYDKPLLKEMGGFAGWSLLGSASSMIAFYGQGLLINVFFGSIINAAQSIAMQISGQLNVFSSSFMNALNPLISKSEGVGNRILMLNATLTGMKVSFFLLSFFCVPFLIDTNFILKLWLNNVPDYSVIFCRLLLLDNLISIFIINLSKAIDAVGNIKEFKKISLYLHVLSTGLTLVFYLLGFESYFLYISLNIFCVLHLFLAVYYSNIFFDLNIFYFFKNIFFRCILSFVLTLAVSSIPKFFYTSSLLNLTFIFLLNILSFSFFTWFIGLTPEERKTILSHLFRIKKNNL